MVPSETQWNALLQRHATITVHIDNRKITGDLYNLTKNQIILIVPDNEDLFQVVNRLEATDISW
ncbi:hypothetical protein PP175_08965 [Aneurinibacillus sp. Ricciae_BoGa-3]|uniref:hypothetical protein n=1 Tax=Aneurinibacillus sp. Ricciae_BoGa-3 TaxID=3022697 RepID=UPI0023428414|nr:hypothetical protein [Aneurinibacillus sp. Ricciae_BoGa-3]WCK56019.1 hypothetical protein PP175_08965 [Aneurinibacillus sp. Ricciae_BoGa-3]